MKNRIAWIDFVRASGMVMIIIVHSLAGIYGSSFLGKVLFAVNVPVFFILSGYLFKEKKLSQVIKGGFFNLILPYVFSAILIALIEQAYSIFPSWVNEFSAKDFVKGALYGIGTPTVLPNKMTIPAIGAIWFLLAMFCGNILFTLAFKLSNRMNRLGTLEFLVIIMVIAGFWTSKYIQLPWSLNAALVSQSFYYADYMIRKYDLVEKANLSLASIGLVLWMISAQSGFFYLNTAFADNRLLAVLGGIGGSYFMMVIAKVITENVATGYIDYYGKLSLIVLSIHLVEMNSLKVNSFIAQHIFTITNSNLAITYAIVFYRLLITILAVVVIPKIPVVRSFYLNRQYPFFKKH